MKEKTSSMQVGGDHYKKNGIEPVEYIHANGLDFFEGNCVKYVTRHKHKNKDEDIKKLIHYATYILKYEYGYTEEEIKNILK